MTQGSRRGGWLLLLFAALAARLIVCTAQITEIRPLDVKEEAVMTDMLNIVDHKFDTLTTRISSLENAVTRLLYHSTRNLQQLQSTLKAAEKDVETVGKQVGQLKVNGDKLNIDMTLLRRDMEQLRSTTTDMLGELESSVVYINNNVDKQARQLRDVVEEAVQRNQREVTSHVSRRIAEIATGGSQSEFPNCSAEFTALTERIDKQFAIFAKEEQNRFDVFANTTQYEISVAYRQIKADMTTANSNQEKLYRQHKKREVIALTTTPSPPLFDEEIREEKRSSTQVNNESDKNSSESSKSTEYNETYYEENDDILLRALMNMTGSVMQAVSYFRHTGRTLEQIMSNSDMIMSSQIDLTRKVESLQSIVTPSGNDPRPVELNNAIPGSERRRQDNISQSTSSFSVAPGNCVVSSDLASALSVISKNGSQLLEVLTDLAQISSVTLTHTTATLQDEIKRIEGIRTRMATTMLAQNTETENKSAPMTQLTNTTQRTLKLVEAIASNTGWLRLIFRNVQHVETLSNRSLQYVSRNHDLLQDLQRLSNEANARLDESLNPDPVISNHIPGIPETVSSPQEGVDRDFVLDKESLETIYSTSLQLNRIMPALTKLLAEPDPLFTLVDGGRLDQGRVEIYNKGQWGTICHQDLTHSEADIICRHLGFKGGISAGPGEFGSGTGVSWSLNASCLASSRCPGVLEARTITPCSHELDVAVICDHMLRIQQTNESDQPLKAGRLEIHHRGVWLPVCGEGWSGYSARVACQQMGFSDGREMEATEWPGAAESQWLGKVACSGNETRLDTCTTDGWGDTCPGLVPAAVRCL